MFIHQGIFHPIFWTQPIHLHHFPLLSMNLDCIPRQTKENKNWKHSLHFLVGGLHIGLTFRSYFSNVSCYTVCLCSSSVPLPQATGFHLRATRKTYLVARLGDLLFEIWLRDENSLTITCFSLFDFLCCIEVYEAKWLNSECLNPSGKSKHRSFNGSVRCVRLTLARIDTEGSFLV